MGIGVLVSRRRDEIGEWGLGQREARPHPALACGRLALAGYPRASLPALHPGRRPSERPLTSRLPGRGV